MRTTPHPRIVAGLLVLTIALAGCAQLDAFIPNSSGLSCEFGMRASVDRVDYNPGQQAELSLTNAGNCDMDGNLAVTLEMPDGASRALASKSGTSIAVGESLTIPFTIPGPKTVPDGESFLKVAAVFEVHFHSQVLDVRASAFAHVLNHKAPEVGLALEDQKGRFTLHYDSALVTADYARKVTAGISTAWDFFEAKGFTAPTKPVHAYIERPASDKELGTLSTQPWGLKLVVAPENMFSKTDPDAQTPAIVAAHEVFHAFQTSYDLEEGWLVEGMATWAMDKVHGTRSGLGHAIQFLNNPDSKPAQYLEYGLVLFLMHLEEKHGEAAVWNLLSVSRDYENRYVFEKAFNADYDDLWAGFVKAIAEKDFTARDRIFRTPIREGDIIRTFRDLQNFTWSVSGPTTLGQAVVGGAVKDAASDETPEAGRIRHAYGIEALRIERSKADPITLTFLPDANTAFHAFLAIDDGKTRVAHPLTADTPFTVNAPLDAEVLLVVTRNGAGIGVYDVVIG